MSATTKKHPIAIMKDIADPDEHYEAAGFVLDSIMADGSCDDPLGDKAALRPVKIARAEDGSILAVLCIVRPNDATSLLQAHADTEVLVSAP